MSTKINFLIPIFSLIPLISLAKGYHSESANSQCPVEFFDLGDYHFEITTNSHLTQRYFDQGINWSYGFNHAEAERNFRKALEHDPLCAMCYWGIAFVLGPNINAPMPKEAIKPAYEALQKAIALQENVTPREKAYIKALSSRYSLDESSDRSHLDRDFAKAMSKLASDFPTDLDALTLYAEALMDTTPWHYWSNEGQPLVATNDIIANLQRVLAKNPNHPGANHYYIHVLEAYHPELGEEAADRLRDLVPDAGHLRHMPSHIYLRIGRYQDAIIANQKGIAADKRYLDRCLLESLYTQMYMPHNYDFLIAASALTGQSRLTLDTAKELSQLVTPLLQRDHVMVDIQQFWITHLMAMVRFGKWNEILKWSQPANKLLYAKGLWHYAKTIAFIRLKKLEEAKLELNKLIEIADNPHLTREMVMGLNSAKSILEIASHEALGEWHADLGELEVALTHLKKAVEKQDSLVYIEPPSWYHSTRLTLGEILLKSNQFNEAEKIFRQDLEKFPQNGWALFGLKQALLKQSKFQEFENTRILFKKAWQYADIQLTSARF